MIKASNNTFECSPSIAGEPPYSEQFTWEEGNPQTFTVPSNISVKTVFHNRTLLLDTEYTITGVVVEITYTTFDPSETNIIIIKN